MSENVANVNPDTLFRMMKFLNFRGLADCGSAGHFAHRYYM